MRRRTTVAMLLAELALTEAGSPALGVSTHGERSLKRRDQRLGMLGAGLAAPRGPLQPWPFARRRAHRPGACMEHDHADDGDDEYGDGDERFHAGRVRPA